MQQRPLNDGSVNNTRCVMIVVKNEIDFLPLLSTGYRLARTRNEVLLLAVISENGDRPRWLRIPERYDRQKIEEQVIRAGNARKPIVDMTRARRPALVAFRGEDESPNLLGGDLDPLLHHIKCPVVIFKGVAGIEAEDGQSHVFLPFSGDNSSRFALDIVLKLNPNARVTVAAVAPEPVDADDRRAQEEELRSALGIWKEDHRVTTMILRGDDPAGIWLAEAEKYDGILLGASRGNVLLRAMLGEIHSTMLDEQSLELLGQTSKPVAIVRQYQGWLGATLSRLFGIGDRLMPTMDVEDRVDTYRQIRRAARPRQDFFIMMALSGGIAALGLILDSPAVIIGAMLIAPLMSSIIGMGLAIIQGDLRFLWTSLGATLRGIALVVFIGGLIGVFYLERHGTGEMLSRTGPTLLDLLVAILSGFAAAYALCRKELSATLPGVAIAVALVPPLATLGLFLGMLEPALAYGALLLFLTNLFAIVVSSSMVFSMVGFRPIQLQDKHGRRIRVFRRGSLAAGIFALLVTSHLTLLSVEEIQESTMEYTIESVLIRYFDKMDELALIDWEVDDHDKSHPLITVQIGAEKLVSRGEISDLADEVAMALESNVEVTLIQTPKFTVLSTARAADESEALE